MLEFKWSVALVSMLIAVQPSLADDRARILGTWKLLSYEAEFQATGEREPTLGRNPTGYVIFTPEGRAMFILTGEGRKAPKTDEDRAELLKTMFAYTGTYRLDGDKWITNVDVAWNPAWVGTEQVRYFKLDGERLQVLSVWMPATVRPEKGMARAVLTFERSK